MLLPPWEGSELSSAVDLCARKEWELLSAIDLCAGKE